MKIWIKIFLLLAGVGLAISVLLRLLRPLAQTVMPPSHIEPPLEPHSILIFVNTCLLFVIALAVLQLTKQK